MASGVRTGCVLTALLLAACGGDPPVPSLSDVGFGHVKALDVGFWEPDAGARDAGRPRDGGAPPEAGAEPDAAPEPEDAGVVVDAGLPSAPDAGPQPLLDSDGDTISDEHEGNGAVDTDGDGIPDHLDLDSDGDGIPDRDEASWAWPGLGVAPPPWPWPWERTLEMPPVDTDGDGIPDFRDLDSDGDGIPDAIEGDGDADGDGIPNFRDLDSDGDGIPDAIEGLADPDGDGIPAFLDLDSDGDGIPDEIEGTDDPDGDGIGNWLDDDSDGDTILDLHEGLGDFDGDGIPNYLDLDSDGDGLPDALEAGDADPRTPPLDSDFDGDPNFLDLDSDNDTILDAEEGAGDSDGDGVPDYLDVDSDNDGVLDLFEAGDQDPLTPAVDSDGDGIPDYLDLDSDGDGIPDAIEGLVDTDGDGVPDRLDLDSDGDGWPDHLEGQLGASGRPRDTDGDGVPDFRDLDSDGDGLLDAEELGCPNSTERLLADSDGDGAVDPAELIFGSAPCDPAQSIQDFYFVLPPRAPPQTAPLVFRETEIDRLDLAINVDTTGTMGGEIAELQRALTAVIIPGVEGVAADAAFAVSAFEDYPVAPFGDASFGDRPFRLATRATTSATAAQAAVSGLVLGSGGDLPESGLEALYQIATGAGTRWGPGAASEVVPFDPMAGLVPGVADGAIGGVGFRQGALPVIVHVTDAPSHLAETYARVSSEIDAAAPDAVLAALGSIGARVITLASGTFARPHDPAVTDPIFAGYCQGTAHRFLGRIAEPAQTDVDWYELSGVSAGDEVFVELWASRVGSTLDTVVGVFDGAGHALAMNDDLALGVVSDSRLTVTLSGAAPFYVAVGSYNDTSFTAQSGITTGFYFADVRVNGGRRVPSVRTCDPSSAGTSSLTASPLVPAAQASVIDSPAACLAACQARIAHDPLRLPYGLAQATGALVPTCTWDAFGSARPAGCGAGQCCTGPGGAGRAPSPSGSCPLAFELSAHGAGLGEAVVAGIQALLGFATFEITTTVRGDPEELERSGIDTRCFIHGVIAEAATRPTSCGPAPVPADLAAPAGELDGFVDVVPGAALTFRVAAENRDPTTGLPCAEVAGEGRVFRASIDVVADGVTVVDTREVVVIVPPALPERPL